MKKRIPEIIIAVLVVLMLALLWFQVFAHIRKQKERLKDPPPGYSVVCDDKGDFGFIEDDYPRVVTIRDYYKDDAKPFQTRTEAIEIAWRAYDFHERHKNDKPTQPSMVGNRGWHTCEQ